MWESICIAESNCDESKIYIYMYIYMRDAEVETRVRRTISLCI